MTTKNILIVSAIAIAAAGFVIKDEIERLKQIFSKFKLTPVAVRNVDVKINGFKPTVSFNLDLNFFNPTFNNFVFNGTIMSIKKLLFYTENSNFLGVSDVNIKTLQVDANTGTVLRNIPITFDAINVVGLISGAIDTGISEKTVRVEMIVSVLGLEYKIG